MSLTSPKPVLIVTNPDDVTTDLVVIELQKCDVPIFRFDTADFPQKLQLNARLIDGQWTGTLATDQHDIALESVQGIYYRRPNSFQFPKEMSDTDWEFAYGQAQRGLGGVLSSLNCRWMNKPGAELLAEYKPRQLAVASESGLQTPRTLITNNKASVMDFAGSVSGPLICKALHAPSIFENGEELSIFTTVLNRDELDGLAGIELTAHQFQEWVPKQYEVRLTVANDQMFAISIRTTSEAGQVDWRLDYGGMQKEVIEVPPQVASGVRSYLSRFGLAFGAFDFIVTPDDEWVFLECNPSGQWAWIEDLAWPIAGAIADYLTTSNT